MSKKVKVLTGVLVAVLVITFGGTAIALADEQEETQPVTNGWGVGQLLTRIAEILEIPEEELLNAFNQAHEEMGVESQHRFMDGGCLFPDQIAKREQLRLKIQDRVLGKAMERGFISENETAAIEEWWQDRPGALDNVMPRARIFNAFRGRHMMAGHGGWHGQAPSQPAE